MVDNDLPPRLAVALHAIFDSDGDLVISLREKFGRADVKDEEWIPALGAEKGWAVISADGRIAKKRPSRELFLRNGLVGFFFKPALQKSPFTRRPLACSYCGREFVSNTAWHRAGASASPCPARNSSPSDGRGTGTAAQVGRLACDTHATRSWIMQSDQSSSADSDSVNQGSDPCRASSHHQ